MKILIVANAVVARVMDASDELRLKLVDLMSYQTLGSEHRSGDWSGRSTLFSYERSTFPAGLISLVISFLKGEGYQVSLSRKAAPEPKGPINPIIDAFGYTEDYSYQYEAVEQLVKHRQIIAQVATGGGKSRIAQIALARLQVPTLFITTRSVLMHQMKRGFEKSLKERVARGETYLDGIRVGVMGDGDFSPTKTVCVAMVQTIQAKLHDPDPAIRERMKEVLKTYQFVIAEEAHEASGDSYYEVLSLCTEAHYRLALTATPFMKEDEEANMKLMACSGPIAIQVTEKDLIDKGILATPKFKYLDAPPVPEVQRASNWQRAYHYGITHNDGRNKVIAKEAFKLNAHGCSVMTLVQRKEHGEILKNMMTAAGLRVRYIFGESDQAARDQALTDLAKREIDVLIGSTILDVGVDVPSVGAVILAGGGKAEIALRQRIGRGLRRKPAPLKNVSYIVDFNDPKNKYLIKHSAQRRAIVEATPGFRENILSPGEEFNFGA